MTRRMKAVLYDRFGGPEVVRCGEVADPGSPPPGWVRVELRAATLIPADAKLRAGLLREIFPVDLPKIPGRDGAGLVTEVGDGVADLKPGDRVAVVAQHMEPGTCSTHRLCRRDAVVRVPDELEFGAAAALMHAGICAWIGLVEEARLRAGQRLLVHAGSGAVGGAALQIARDVGAEVWTTCSARNADYVTGLGADHVVLRDRERDEALPPFDVIFDLIGGETHARSFGLLAPTGVMVHLRAEPVPPPPPGLDVRLVHVHDDPAALAAVVALAERGALRPQIARRMPLEEAREAHRLFDAGEISRGRIVFDIG